MRASHTSGTLSLRAIAAAHVVLLAIDCEESTTADLLGFRLWRTHVGSGERTELPTALPFAGRDDVEPTRLLQGFQWADYRATPGTAYRYAIQAIHGDPADPTLGEQLSVDVRTEDPAEGTHGVHFNRGVAGSQAYVRRFGEAVRYYPEVDERRGRLRWNAYLRPDDIPDRAAHAWLSRGLEEALLAFIENASDERWSLRASLYELTHGPAIRAFVDALERGVDVKIVHHCKPKTRYTVDYDRKAVSTTTFDDDRSSVTMKNRALQKVRSPDPIGQAALDAVHASGLGSLEHREAWEAMLIPRTRATISHNKFIVLCQDDEPVAVWTGSTNLTAGGIFGQSNVGHEIRDPEVARAYLDAWERLAEDPKKTSRDEDDLSAQRNWTVHHQPDLPAGRPPEGTTVVFSPRRTAAMLDWYGDLISQATHSVHLTTAFTVSGPILEAVSKDAPTEDPYARFLLLEGKGGLLRDKVPLLQAQSANRVAWGDTLSAVVAQEEGTHREVLTGLNDHVSFLHTKYLLIDPLTDDPIVVTGSANFSEASTVDNDENMVVVRGDTRLADQFLCEFMRLHHHFESRNRRNEEASTSPAALALAPDDSWCAPAFEQGSPAWNERLLFAAPL